MAQSIENMSAPEDIFHALVENSLRLSGGESAPEGLVDELCSNESLINVSISLIWVIYNEWRLVLYMLIYIVLVCCMVVVELYSFFSVV